MVNCCDIACFSLMVWVRGSGDGADGRWTGAPARERSREPFPPGACTHPVTVSRPARGHARHARGRSSPARLPDSLAAFEPRIIAPRYLGHASDEMRFHDMISYIRHEVNSLRRGTRGKFG